MAFTCLVLNLLGEFIIGRRWAAGKYLEWGEGYHSHYVF